MSRQRQGKCLPPPGAPPCGAAPRPSPASVSPLPRVSRGGWCQYLEKPSTPKPGGFTALSSSHSWWNLRLLKGCSGVRFHRPSEKPAPLELSEELSTAKRHLLPTSFFKGRKKGGGGPERGARQQTGGVPWACAPPGTPPCPGEKPICLAWCHGSSSWFWFMCFYCPLPVMPHLYNSGYDAKTFSWASYLEKTKAKAAPARLFNSVSAMRGVPRPQRHHLGPRPVTVGPVLSKLAEPMQHCLQGVRCVPWWRERQSCGEGICSLASGLHCNCIDAGRPDRIRPSVAERQVALWAILYC